MEKYEAKMAKKMGRMTKRSEKVCEKKEKFQAAVCEKMEDKENCQQWAKAMQEKCSMNRGCKIELAGNQGRCSGGYKAMLKSLRTDEEKFMEGLEDSAAIGNCFKTTIDAFSVCKAGAKKATEDNLKDVTVPTEE